MINLNKVKYLQRLNNSYGYVKFMIEKIPRIFEDQKLNLRQITVPSYFTFIFKPYKMNHKQTE